MQMKNLKTRRKTLKLIIWDLLVLMKPKFKLRTMTKMKIKSKIKMSKNRLDKYISPCGILRKTLIQPILISGIWQYSEVF